MITYLIECQQCKEKIEIMLPITEHHTLLDRVCLCGAKDFRQLYNNEGVVTMKSPFPRGWSEHIAPTPVYIRDKSEAKDVAAQNGLTSIYCENDM